MRLGCVSKSSTNNGMAPKSSTGISKNPCICPACKSIVTILLAPATSNIFATSLPVIGVLETGFLSCLA